MDKRLLIVEDDPGLQSALRWSFPDAEVFCADNGTQAAQQIRRHQPQVVTLDLGLPPDPGGVSAGFAALKEILSLDASIKVIVVTGHGDRVHALNAIQLGAYDFYEKPADAEVLGLIVARAFALYDLEREIRNTPLLTAHTPLQGIITASAPMLQICRTIEKLAPSTITTLLLGESGTGKEILARALHHLSPRAARRFVAINCAAIPETLLESELFGYEKGAFTGAHRQVLGRIEYADGGTLFLDEVADLPFSLQAKLLRFLQERIIERIGGREEIAVDVRVLCATHQDLAALIAQGRFREDLYYRISEATLRIPPLRERAGDAVLLARHFLEFFTKQHNGIAPSLDSEALRAVENHTWPGNVRELENRLKRALVMREGKYVTAKDLELSASESKPPLELRVVRDRAEYEALVQALAQCGGNMSKAAEMLSITRPTLYALLRKHKLGASGDDV